MNTSEILDRAADLIQERGWGRVEGWFPKPDEATPVCVEGAIRVAAMMGAETNWFALYKRTKDALSAYLGDRHPECINSVAGRVFPFSWNDRPDRTASEVIEVLRAAAMVERAREAAEQLAAVSA